GGAGEAERVETKTPTATEQPPPAAQPTPQAQAPAQEPQAQAPAPAPGETENAPAEEETAQPPAAAEQNVPPEEAQKVSGGGPAAEMTRYLESNPTAPKHFAVEGVSFEVGSSELTPDSKMTVDQMASTLGEHPDVK